MNTHAHALLLALVATGASGEVMMAKPLSNDAGTISCAMDAGSIEHSATADGPAVGFNYVCENHIAGTIGAESVMVLCNRGDIFTLRSFRVAADGSLQPEKPTERKGIPIGSMLHDMANQACAYARAKEAPPYAKELGR